ncbi:hypothetical protein M758_UG247400 [Ceratodon purpureus]|nr:hypothetical protein M758_UG247400 [Ceratodon purpureus]
MLTVASVLLGALSVSSVVSKVTLRDRGSTSRTTFLPGFSGSATKYTCIG